VITQPRSRDDSDRRIPDTAALKNDYVWWSFYWSRANATYRKLILAEADPGPVR
jgi:hypothetical protein